MNLESAKKLNSESSNSIRKINWETLKRNETNYVIGSGETEEPPRKKKQLSTEPKNISIQMMLDASWTPFATIELVEEYWELHYHLDELLQLLKDSNSNLFLVESMEFVNFVINYKKQTNENTDENMDDGIVINPVDPITTCISSYIQSRNEWIEKVKDVIEKQKSLFTKSMKKWVEVVNSDKQSIKDHQIEYENLQNGILKAHSVEKKVIKVKGYDMPISTAVALADLQDEELKKADKIFNNADKVLEVFKNMIGELEKNFNLLHTAWTNEEIELHDIFDILNKNHDILSREKLYSWWEKHKQPYDVLFEILEKKKISNDHDFDKLLIVLRQEKMDLINKTKTDREAWFQKGQKNIKLWTNLFI